MSDSKILVTGATGFIGSRLVEKLIEKKFNVTSFVRDKNNVNPNSNFVVGDLTDKELDFAENFDTVFHLASHTPLEKNKTILEKVNLDGTKNFFNAIKNKTKSIVYISGLGVYGETGENIVDESFSYNPNTNFVKIRVKAQKFLEENCKENGIDFTVVHFGDVYGSKGWFYEALVSRLLKKLSTFKMPKGGNYNKAFVHVDDAVGSLIAILEKKSFNEKYIVADSTVATFKEFVDLTADQIGVKHPGSIPTFLAKAVLGGDLIKLLITPIKVSNKKISQIYEFKYHSYKEGIPIVVSELKANGVL